MKYISILQLCLLPFLLWGQKRGIEGQVVDLFSKEPIADATIELLNTTPPQLVRSNEYGRFRIEALQAGRYKLLVSHPNYQETFIPDIVVTSGQNVVLRVNIQEQVQREDEGEKTQELKQKLRAQQASKQQNISSKLVLTGIRPFTINEVERYTGARDDVKRLVSNFAAVRSYGAELNELVVRGLPGSQMRYMIDGLPVQNISHVGSPNSTGGIFPLLNQNLMGNSSFLVGGYSADYMNTASGVFDIRLREGNQSNTQITAQLSVNGLEATAEGPLSKKTGASYMVSYRHALFPILEALNINIIDAAPSYQDLHLKFDLPTKKAGTFSLFATGGLGDLNLRLSPVAVAPHQNSEIAWINSFAGLSHRLSLSPKTNWETTLGTNYMSYDSALDSLSPQGGFFDKSSTLYQSTWTSLNTAFNIRLKPFIRLRTGLLSTLQNLNYEVAQSGDILGTVINYRGLNHYSQAFAQYYHEWTERLSSSVGFNIGYYSLNERLFYSARLALRYQLSPKQNLSFSYAHIPNINPLFASLQEYQDAQGQLRRLNQGLDFAKTRQFTLEYNYNPNHEWLIRFSAYAYLWRDIPISTDSSAPIVLNDVMSVDLQSLTMRLPQMDNLGLGRQWGTELSIEKYFARSFYMLFTGSFFDVQYRNILGEWNNSAYNSRYIASLLLGKELIFNKEKGHAFTFDARAFYTGGFYYTPFDEQASAAAAAHVPDYSRYMQARGENNLRFDCKLGVRINSKRVTHVFFIDAYNILNTFNTNAMRYDYLNERSYNWQNTGRLLFITYRARFSLGKN